MLYIAAEGAEHFFGCDSPGFPGGVFDKKGELCGHRPGCSGLNRLAGNALTATLQATI